MAVASRVSLRTSPLHHALLTVERQNRELARAAQFLKRQPSADAKPLQATLKAVIDSAVSGGGLESLKQEFCDSKYLAEHADQAELLVQLQVSIYLSSYQLHY